MWTSRASIRQPRSSRARVAGFGPGIASAGQRAARRIGQGGQHDRHGIAVPDAMTSRPSRGGAVNPTATRRRPSRTPNARWPGTAVQQRPVAGPVMAGQRQLELDGRGPIERLHRQAIGRARPFEMRRAGGGGQVEQRPPRRQACADIERQRARIGRAEGQPRPILGQDLARAAHRRHRGHGWPDRRTGRSGSAPSAAGSRRRTRRSCRPARPRAAGRGGAGASRYREPGPSGSPTGSSFASETRAISARSAGVGRPDDHPGPASRRPPAIAATRRSWGRAWAVMPSRPTIVSAATSALTIASSVASIVASNSASIAGSRDHPQLRRPSRAAGAAARRGSPRLPVANARMRSPLVSRRPAGAPDPERRPLGDPLALVRQERRVGRDDHDDRARARRRRSARPRRARDRRRRDRLADRHAVDAQPLAPAVVRLDEHAERPAAATRVEHPRRRPDPALELVADHPGAAADAALGDGPAAAAARAASASSAVTWKPSMSFSRPSHVSPTTGSDQATRRPARLRRSPDQRVVDDPDAVRVRQPDRAAQQAGLADPLEPGQLAVPVQPVRSRRRRVRSRCRRRAGRSRSRRSGPAPAATSGPSPRMIVRWPTRTPGTSVIALSGPGRPVPMAMPRSRARIAAA